jgi:hypothetical protein
MGNIPDAAPQHQVLFFSFPFILPYGPVQKHNPAGPPLTHPVIFFDLNSRLGLLDGKDDLGFGKL